MTFVGFDIRGELVYIWHQDVKYLGNVISGVNCEP